MSLIISTDANFETQAAIDGNLKVGIREPKAALDSRLIRELREIGYMPQDEGISPDVLEELAKQNPRIKGPLPIFQYEYDGIKALSRQNEGYPDPTFNHFKLAQYLKQNITSAKGIIDMGCGAAFLGNYAAATIDLEEVLFADMNPVALKQAVFSYQLNHPNSLETATQIHHERGTYIKTNKHRLDLRIGDVTTTLKNFDGEDHISVACPMYMPELCEVFPQAYALFAKTAKDIGSKLYIAHSNLSNDLVEKSAQWAGSKLKSVSEEQVQLELEYIDSSKDPKKVKETLQSLGLREYEGKPYHKIIISEFS